MSRGSGNLKETNKELYQLIQSLGLNLKNFSKIVYSATYNEEKAQSLYMRFKSKFDGGGDADPEYVYLVVKALDAMSGQLSQFLSQNGSRLLRVYKIQKLLELDINDDELDKLIKTKSE